MTANSILEQIYSRKVKLNPNYSRRAFARDLKCSPSFLTNLMKGRRRLTVTRAEEMARNSKMEKRLARMFVKAILLENMAAAAPREDIADLLSDASGLQAHEMNVDQFQFFNSWYHVAVLDLVACVDFQPNSQWIATRLGIQPEAAFATVDRLKRLGLLKVEAGKLVKTNAHLRIPTQENGLSPVVAFHRHMIEKAVRELDITEDSRKANRLITGITLSMPRSKIPAAKLKVQTFLREMAAELTDGPADEVVQLNVQLFPLTK